MAVCPFVMVMSAWCTKKVSIILCFSENRLLTYRQTGQVKLKCMIRLDRLFKSKAELKK